MNISITMQILCYTKEDYIINCGRMDMPKETTPTKVIPRSKIIVVPVMLESPAPKNECFLNVNTVVEKIGGELISGWAIWQWANILIEAEAHAVWKNPSGDLIDITPHDGEKEIFFLPDDKVVYRGMRIPSRRMALTESSLVKEFIHLLEQRDMILCNPKGNYVSLPTDLVSHIEALKMRFQTKVTQKSLCPCGSGLKYKKCCNPYN